MNKDTVHICFGTCFDGTKILTDLLSDSSIITGNIGKIGIGLVSCFFDVILLVQHFCLYGKNNNERVEQALDTVEEKSPIVSQELFQRIAR